MPQENLTEAVNGLQKAWADFKDTNEKRIEALEKGQGAGEYEEQLVKINKQIDTFIDQQQAIDKARKEDAARADEIERKVNLLQGTALGGGGKVSDVKRDAVLFQAARSGRPLSELGEVDVKEYQDYTEAFDIFLRCSPDSKQMQKVRNALSAGSDPDGGYWMPTQMQSRILTRLFESSDIRSIAGQLTISSGDSVEYPNDTNTGVSGGWVSETGTRSDTNTPQVGTQRIVTHEQYAQPKATQKILDDAAIDVEGWLAGKIADILARTENTAFVSGNGVGKPRGFLDYGAAAVTTADASRAWGVLQYIATGASAGFPLISGATVANDANALLDIVYALKAAYRSGARWVMARSTVALIRKLRDENGQYYWNPGLQPGQPGLLLNYPITEAEDMPVAASNSLSVAFGNFKEGYQIVDRQGIRILRDPYTDKPFVKFYTTKRVGGDVVNFDAIKLLKFAAS